MTQTPHDELRLRPTRLNGNPPAPDDFEVYWRDIPVGRILKQSGTPIGKPNWFWGIILPNKPQPVYHRGICSDVEECKRRFKVAWSGVRATLTEGELTIIRRHLADLERRARWPGSKYPAKPFSGCYAATSETSGWRSRKWVSTKAARPMRDSALGGFDLFNELSRGFAMRCCDLAQRVPKLFF